MYKTVMYMTVLYRDMIIALYSCRGLSLCIMQLDYWCVLCILICTMSVWPCPCTYMYAHVSFCPVHADNIKYMYMYTCTCPCAYVSVLEENSSWTK